MMTMFVVYERPRDFPSGYVVRRWLVGPDGRLFASTRASTASSLELARSAIPSGLYRLERFAEDDPAVREVWL